MQILHRRSALGKGKNMTEQLYLQNTYLMETDASIVGCGEDPNGNYFFLDRTVFYPQGGGQPCDRGEISCGDFAYSVDDVRRVGDEIRHYVQTSPGGGNRRVKCSVDGKRRLLNARYHSAGHLLGNVAEALCPDLRAVKCHAFPGEAYVAFQGGGMPDGGQLQELLRGAIGQKLEIRSFEANRRLFEPNPHGLPGEIPGDKAFRAVQIGNYGPIPCGGTHVASVEEIGEIFLGKIRRKDGVLRLAYGVP
jgi:alanyl-tRNA synthetase